MSRIAIFSCNIGKNAELYEYQRFIISELNHITDKIIVIYNGEKMSDQDNDNVQWHYTSKKFDVLMWKERILDLYEKKELSEYDELILLNDSFFGPLYSFELIFNDMNCPEIDFWGITVHGEIPKNYMSLTQNKQETWPRFLQRYFMVFKKNVLNDKLFLQFWTELPDMDLYLETEQKFEFIFTNQLEQWGYCWKAYCETKEWEAKETEKYMSFLLFKPFKMLTEKKLPVISRQLFIMPKEVELCYSCVNEVGKVIDFINNNTYYDMDLIYSYMVENLNTYSIWEKLNLTYVFNKNSETHKKKEFSHNIVLFVHLYYKDMFTQSIEYLKKIPERIDIIFSTVAENINDLKIICQTLKNRYIILQVDNRGREWGSFLIEAKSYILKYDYLCFLHDKKSSQLFYSSLGESFHSFLWENMIASEEYVYAILDRFDKEKRLGVLVPPIVYQGEFWGHFSDFWTICFDETYKLAKRLDLHCLPDEKYPVLTIGSCFWAKVDAIKKLLDYPFNIEHFPNEPLPNDGAFNHALERIIAFVAQDAGFYTGIIINDEYARFDLTNFNSMLRNILNRLKYINGIDITTIYSTLESLKGDCFQLETEKTKHNRIKKLMRRLF